MSSYAAGLSSWRNCGSVQADKVLPRHCHPWFQCLASLPVMSRRTKSSRKWGGVCVNWSWEQRTLEYKECTVEQEPLLTTMTSHGSAACSSLYHSSAVDLCAHPSRGGQLQQEHSFSFCLLGKIQRPASSGEKAEGWWAYRGWGIHWFSESTVKIIPRKFFFMISYGPQGR